MGDAMQALLEQTILPPQEELIPFIITKRFRLYLGDAVDTLNRLPAESVDMIFADPPYNLSNGGTTCHAGKRVSVNKALWDASCGIKDDFAFHMRWIQACRRVLRAYDQIREAQAGNDVEHIGGFPDRLLGVYAIMGQAGAANQHGNSGLFQLLQ